VNSPVSAMRRLDSIGMNRGSSGNCSIRITSGFLITPSGIPVEALKEELLVEMSLEGEAVPKTTEVQKSMSVKPSSEWRFHRDIYARRPEVNAIVHSHSPFATTLACLNLDVPPFHYMIAIAGGDSIRCAPYELFGTQELSNVALEALAGRKACLLQNHGMIAIGSNLQDALRVAIETESLCEQYWRVIQVGKPHLLTSEEMNRVMEKFKFYGETNPSLDT
jgi:L-fuculose-phosphate aldolase